jgi:hypothetical protein
MEMNEKLSVESGSTESVKITFRPRHREVIVNVTQISSSHESEVEQRLFPELDLEIPLSKPSTRSELKIESSSSERDGPA